MATPLALAGSSSTVTLNPTTPVLVVGWPWPPNCVPQSAPEFTVIFQPDGRLRPAEEPTTTAPTLLGVMTWICFRTMQESPDQPSMLTVSVCPLAGLRRASHARRGLDDGGAVLG